MMNNNIWVTQPYLPPLNEFIPYLEEIWDKKVLTNNGVFHQQFEKQLGEYLGVHHLSLINNGTLALMLALSALEIKGEVITTPYSFIATAHSLLWNNIKPVFVDIEPNGFNLNPDNIEAAITDKTTAIMPVHCYGYPCDVESIQNIADKYQLKVIYDAAHAFSVNYKGQSLLNYGDASILSFHATKVFNTFEGGAIICRDFEIKKKIEYLKNFGFENETSVFCVGINGKMAEINAALGLSLFPHLSTIFDRRKTIIRHYREELKDIIGVHYYLPFENTEENGAYFPILIQENYPLSRDELYEALQTKGIYGRRYFYPLISNFQIYSHFNSAKIDNLPIANKIANQVICLPIYPDLSLDKVKEICAYIREWA